MARPHSFARRSPRIDVRWPAMLTNADGARSEVLLLDLSSGGFRVEHSQTLRVGEFVNLEVGKEELEGRICWTLGREAGGAFLAPVDYMSFR